MRRSDRISMSQLQQDYHALAKKADARLRAIEGYAYDKHFKDIKRYAYAKAMEDIKMWSGGSARRFETKMPDETEAQRNEIRSKMVDIQRFLDMPTSTKKGVIAIYKKRAETINKRHTDSNLTWQQLATYYELGIADKLDKDYGSKTALKTIGAINNLNKDKSKVLKKLKEIASPEEAEILEQVQSFDEILDYMSKYNKTQLFIDDEVLAHRLSQAIAKFGKELILK